MRKVIFCQHYDRHHEKHSTCYRPDHFLPDTANEAHQGVVPYCGIYRVEPT